MRTIPAGQPFLDTLVDAMVEALDPARDPLALADALIFVPNRRAGRALLDAFAARAPTVTMPPAIRPLGDIDDDPEVWGPAALEIALPPAIPILRRRLELATLVQARDQAERGFADPVRALALADALAALLDSAAFSEKVDWSLLPHLVEEADLAAHWLQAMNFLSIVSEAWPQRLAEDGLTDPGARRALLLTALAEHWAETRPDRPIIIAGSTGSVAAARTLMRVVAGLPRGCVILPGLDGALPADHAKRLGAGHPQAAVRAAARALAVDPSEIATIAAREDHISAARGAVLREALAPAESTADWLARLDAAGGGAWLREGLSGLRLVEAATPEEEASVCALLLRQALETPGRTAALVTPDRSLSSRVSAKLARWGISAPPSAGGPLSETQAGAMLGLLLDLALDDGAPIALAALVRHPACAFDPIARAQLERGGKDLLGLRGARRWRDLADLTVRVHAGAQPILHAIAAALAPLQAALAAPLPLDVAAAALGEAAEALAGPALWEGEGGAAAAKALDTIVAHGAGLGLMAPEEAVRALARLLSEVDAPPLVPAHPRLSLWGPLEARLQQRDLVILAGLNEGVWPAPPPEDPFLTRGMRAKLGLPDPDVRLGLAAHDFAHLAAGPEVVLTRAKRSGDAPSVASRWIWRLVTLAEGAGARDALAFPADQCPIAWARALDAPQRRIVVEAPAPRPPIASRPRAFAVTRVETLIRDPYAIYARDVLGLRALDPIGAPFGPKERGTAIHAALERFAKAGGDAAHLLDVLDREFAAWGLPPERRKAERARLSAAADAFAAWHAARTGPQWRCVLETEGRLEHDGFLLTAKADRIDFGPEGAEIIDFKTGSPPTDAMVETGLTPQLPLEAALLAAGVFAEAPAAQARALIYWRFAGSGAGPRAVSGDAHQRGVDTLARLAGLLARYADETQPYLSKPRAKFSIDHGDYDLLARRKEWANAEGDA